MDKKSLKLDLSGINIPTIEEFIEREFGRTLAVLKDFIEFRGISCVDAEGKEFEKYDKLLVSKDIFRNPRGKPFRFTPHNAAVYCEQQGLFLPSFALTCNIAAALYQNRKDAEINKILLQYKDCDDGYGWHTQNTALNYASEEIIHYPSAGDFYQTTTVNIIQTTTVNINRQRKALKFVKETLQDNLLESVLNDNGHLRFVKQLTGLEDPSILVKIGKYFDQPARLWFPWNGQAGASYNNKQVAWLGCSSDSFDLYAYTCLDSSNAARGVHRG